MHVRSVVLSEGWSKREALAVLPKVIMAQSVSNTHRQEHAFEKTPNLICLAHLEPIVVSTNIELHDHDRTIFQTNSTHASTYPNFK